MNSKDLRNPFRRRKTLASVALSMGHAEHAIKISVVSKEVANRIDKWMSDPYKEAMTEKQDIELFALRITNYIITRMKE